MCNWNMPVFNKLHPLLLCNCPSRTMSLHLWIPLSTTVHNSSISSSCVWICPKGFCRLQVVFSDTAFCGWAQSWITAEIWFSYYCLLLYLFFHTSSMFSMLGCNHFYVSPFFWQKSVIFVCIFNPVSQPYAPEQMWFYGPLNVCSAALNSAK